MIEARARNDPGELTASLRGMGTGRGPTLWGELAGLRVSALVVTGEFDEKFVRVSHRMAGSCPNVRVAVVPDAGHNVRAEVPETYLSLLETFLLQAPW
jgi:2-succinyl-6-hydroxy-2,4-cyclohexadiene-1-carboxylate synthase